MIVPFPLSQSDHQMQRVRSCVEQHRNAPFRSADWLAGELMKICETAPDNDTATQPATSQEGEAREPMAHLGVRYTVAGVMAEMLAVGTADDEGDLAEDWPLDCRADVDRWQAVIRNALAATPTPPTLSQDDDLAWFGKHRNLELSHYSPYMGDEDDQSVEWRVTRQSGHYNDREWTVVGTGETPAAAIAGARATLAQVKAS